MDKNEIFRYDNYREFFSDYLQAQKRKRSTFSARYFSEIAGFSSSNYCSLILNGKRNLTLASLPKMIKGMNLKGRQAKYFEALVKFNQSDKILEKEKHYSDMESIRKFSDYKNVKETQYKLFYKWYYGVVLETASIVDWKNDFSLLASLIKPNISEREAREAVEFLLESELLIENDTGIYEMNDPYITDDDVPVFIRSKNRKEVLELGIEACKTMGSNERYTTISTYKLSDNGYINVLSAFEDFKQRVSEIVMDDNGDKKVYELINQLFPVTEKLRIRKEITGR